MRLSWKLFFITTPVVVLFLTVFGTWMVQDSFGNSIEQELERSLVENKMFQNSYELTRHSLTEEQWSQTTVPKVVESFYTKRSEREGCVRIFDEDGTVLYQDNGLRAAGPDGRTAGEALMQSLDEEHNVASMLSRTGERRYIVVVSRSSYGGYIEMSRDVTFLYELRDAMYMRYQAGVLVLAVVMGGVILAVLFFVMRNMQKLSRATQRFARGQYDTRVEVRSRDEIGRLANDFNWMADAMNRQMKQLENEVRRQEEFTAAFAHELKTPLTSIIGYADTIRQMDLTKEETDMCANYIFRQGKRLQTLSFRLLEMTMAGKNEIEKKEIQVQELLEELRQISAISLQEKGLTCVTEAQNGVIFGERELLLSLFLNLVDNARKASPPGKCIFIRGYRQQEGYLITVEDEGPGIPQEELARITEAFYMVDKSRARKEGGAGLGLALGQKIVELHQAYWRFENREEGGLCVSVLFWKPLQRSPQRGERRTAFFGGRRARKGQNKDKRQIARTSRLQEIPDSMGEKHES